MRAESHVNAVRGTVRRGRSAAHRVRAADRTTPCRWRRDGRFPHRDTRISRGPHPPHPLESSRAVGPTPFTSNLALRVPLAHNQFGGHICATANVVSSHRRTIRIRFKNRRGFGRRVSPRPQSGDATPFAFRPFLFRDPCRSPQRLGRRSDRTVFFTWRI